MQKLLKHSSGRGNQISRPVSLRMQRSITVNLSSKGRGSRKFRTRDTVSRGATLSKGNIRTQSETFVKVLSSGGSSQFAFDAQLRLGDSYYYMKEYANAAGAYRGAIQSFPAKDGIDYAYYQLAQSEYKSDKFDTGIKDFEDLISRFPNSGLAGDAEYGIGWIYFQSKKYDKAIGIFQTVISRYPKSELLPKAYYSIGDSVLQSGKIYRGDPGIPECRNEISRVRVCERRGQRHPGTCYVLLDKPADAVRSIDDYIKNNPSARTADELFYKKADIYFSQKQYDDAVKAYQEFLQKFPKSKLAPDAYYWTGKCYTALNNYPAALEAFQTIAAKYPSSKLASTALFEEGGVYAQEGKPTEALASFAKIQEQYPKSDEAADASYQQGVVLKSTNQTDDAVRKFEATITQYPKSAASDRSRVALGWMNQSVENYTRALEYFKAVATNRTDELGAEAQYALGVTQQSSNNYSEAILSFLRVKYVFPSAEDWITKAYFNLGDCYEKTNQKQKAKEAYNIVIKQGGELAAEAEQRLRKLEQL